MPTTQQERGTDLETAWHDFDQTMTDAWDVYLAETRAAWDRFVQARNKAGSEYTEVVGRIRET